MCRRSTGAVSRNSRSGPERCSGCVETGTIHRAATTSHKTNDLACSRNHSRQRQARDLLHITRLGPGETHSGKPLHFDSKHLLGRWESPVWEKTNEPGEDRLGSFAIELLVGDRMDQGLEGRPRVIDDQAARTNLGDQFAKNGVNPGQVLQRGLIHIKAFEW